MFSVWKIEFYRHTDRAANSAVSYIINPNSRLLLTDRLPALYYFTSFYFCFLFREKKYIFINILFQQFYISFVSPYFIELSTPVFFRFSRTIEHIGCFIYVFFLWRHKTPVFFPLVPREVRTKRNNMLFLKVIRLNCR